MLPTTSKRHDPENSDEEQRGSPRKKVKVNGQAHALESEDDVTTIESSPQENITHPSDLYLDTIDRSRLDFDFEKLCSVSLSNVNVYACLVCGKYFQGRGKSSHAYFHSLDQDHHVYLNMQNTSVWILPEGYQVNDTSLNDIKYVVNPTFKKEQVFKMDHDLTFSYDFHNKPYLPGFIGLNNIKNNDFMNVVIQSLAHVGPLRNFLLLQDLSSRSEIVQRFGLLIRKIWNPKAFKGQVSPHELLQQISKVSEKKFQLTKQGDPMDFLSWFLNTLHRDLGGTKKPGSSIIHKIFQGMVRVETQEIIAQEIDDDTVVAPTAKFNVSKEVKTMVSPFLFLAFDLPSAPVFMDDIEKGNIIPQVPIYQLLAKYNGIKSCEVDGQLRRYKITKLPPFIIFHVRRFVTRNFVTEKNPTIMTFPVKNLDMSEVVETDSKLDTLGSRYDLVANITHEGGASATALTGSTTTTTSSIQKSNSRVYKVNVHTPKTPERWFQIQDLIVDEVNPNLIGLGEAYIQIWQKRK